MLSAYSKFIVRHSYLILLILSIICTSLSIIPLVCHRLPSFTDPLVGFETRGTALAQRFIAWENLIDETRPSRRLAVNPKEVDDQIRMNRTYNKSRHDRPRSSQRKPVRHKKKPKNKQNYNNSDFSLWYNHPDSNISNGHIHWGYGKNVTFEDENIVFLKDHTRKQWITLKEMQREPDKPLHVNYASGTCGSPISDYAHLVITSTDNSSLLTFDNVMNMCRFQKFLLEIDTFEYHKLCQRSIHYKNNCCPVWSVPNYIALISGKDSCENITQEDVSKTTAILSKCSSYFHDFSLMASCDLDRCRVPKYCSQYNAIYNLLFYLIDSDAFSPPKYTEEFVKNVIIFFPLPSSSTVLPFYNKLQSSNLSYENLVIPAIEFGLKNTVFDIWVVKDTWLVGIGGLFVFLSVWIYTQSLLLTLLLFAAITYSLGVSYFLYIYMFSLEFFPFMNLLVIVVVIGIGADDAFLYVKVWKMISNQLIRDNVTSEDSGFSGLKNVSSAGETILIQILEETLRHSVVPIFITSLTTAVAFFASFVSYIPAINCFSIFAGTAVLVNFLLMISWLPASVFIIDVKLFRNKKNIFNTFNVRIIELWRNIRLILNRVVMTCIIRLHLMFTILLGAVGIWSMYIVFYSPGLRLPDTKQFQLFQLSHPFEQYEMFYRDKFLFERLRQDIGTGSKMPLRWIWGIQAIDNGNHMNPSSMGELVFDTTFSISDPESQMWLLEFCKKLKAQPFYQQTLGPLLPNCFIESFKMFMSRKCVDSIDKIDRSPCCESSIFPYKKEVFEFCIIKAMESLYQTSRELFMPGVAGPKFLRNSSPLKVAAVVIEFESVVPYSMSYTAMNNFFLHVENWTRYQLEFAPSGMKGGWFLSDFQFYDLQRTLASGTILALILSASLGFVVLIPATLSCTISIIALTSIIFSSTVTIAVLVLSGWKLNVLESVAISTSAGLAVDFSLHYALSYANASGTKLLRIKNALTSSTGPTAAAAVTTGFAGIFLLCSNLLPYSQIGIFLILIMTISWNYATFFLCSLLYLFGSNLSEVSPIQQRKSSSRVSSICSGVPNLESHELEHLADSNRTNITQSHSPSSISATTIVLHDDLENAHINIDKKSSITMT